MAEVIRKTPALEFLEAPAEEEARWMAQLLVEALPRREIAAAGRATATPVGIPTQAALPQAAAEVPGRQA